MQQFPGASKNLRRCRRLGDLVFSHRRCGWSWHLGAREWTTTSRSAAKDGEVVFLKSINDDLLPSLYRHARLFVYPSMAEGFGVPVIEAMASGVPVISSRTTALSEVAGNAAVLINPYDLDNDSNVIHDLLQDSNRAASLRVLGAQRASEFNWDTEAQKLVQSYRAYFENTILKS